MVVKCSRVCIAPTSAAIRVGGQAGEPLKLSLDIYPDNPEQIQDLLRLRGKELVIVFATVEESHDMPLTGQTKTRNGKHTE